MMKGVVFDFNGTLFFDNDKHVKAWGAISKEIRGRDITEYELHHQLNGVPNEKIIQYFMDGKATKEDINYYSLKKESYYRGFCKEDEPSFRLVAGVEDYFDYLKANNIPFNIASASIKPNIDFFVESFHLDHWMDPDTIVYDNGTYENKIAMFKDSMKLLGIAPEETVVFEDSFSGIKNAYNAGVTQIVVIASKDKWPEYETLPGVLYCMEDFTQVRK